MSPRTLRLLLVPYPARWRRRHGEELTQLIRDLTQDTGTSRTGLFSDLLLAATTQRLSSPALGRTLVIVVVGGTAVTIAPSTTSRQPLKFRTASVVVHRNHAGHITAVSGAPVNVVFNPKTKKVVSITRKQHGPRSTR